MVFSAFRSINMASKNLSLVLGPLLNVTVRIWLGQMFLLSAALQLAAPGQPVPSNIYACFEGWIDVQSPAQVIMVWASMILAVLLAAGFATRFAALILAAMSLAAYGFEAAQQQNLLWALLLGFVVLFGAGPLSVDAILTKNKAHLPSATLTIWLQKGFLVLLRFWLALVIVIGVLGPSEVSNVRDFLAHHPFASGFFEREAHGFLAILAIGFLAPGFLARPAAGLIAPLLAIMAVITGDVETMYLAALAGFLASAGPGWFNLDSWWKLDRWPSSLLHADDDVPHIVVIGAGFGGLSAVVRLAREKCRITLIDRRNYHLFQPLLYQVATAALSPGDISLPIRALFKGRENVRVLLAEVTGVDRKQSQVLLGARKLPYDRLIVATGSEISYHGAQDWAVAAPGLKQIEDATYIRSRLLAAFEHAEDASDPDKRAAWMTFVIIGGGATGVEMAGALAELAHHGLRGEFRNIDPAHARIVLLNRGQRCLGAFAKGGSKVCETTLGRLGVAVINDVDVVDLDAHRIKLADGRKISTRTILWTAGVQASPAAKWLGVTPSFGGRVPVTPELALAQDERVFVIGDTAAMSTDNGEPVPGLAPAAKQAGQYVAKVLRAEMAGWAKPKPFSYVHQGSLATIGRSSAVADFGWLQLSGAPAWWLWGLVHVGFLTGGRNRIAVALQWFWAYLTHHRSTRLITGLPFRPSDQQGSISD